MHSDSQKLRRPCIDMHPLTTCDLRRNAKYIEDAQMKHAPVKKTISFEDFQKVDIRIRTIKSVLEVANSNKLMKLIVDFGDHTRSIIAGIKQERTNPREVEGKQANVRHIGIFK